MKHITLFYRTCICINLRVVSLSDSLWPHSKLRRGNGLRNWSRDCCMDNALDCEINNNGSINFPFKLFLQRSIYESEIDIFGNSRAVLHAKVTQNNLPSNPGTEPARAHILYLKVSQYQFIFILVHFWLWIYFCLYIEITLIFL